MGYPCRICKRPYSMSVWSLPAENTSRWLIPEVYWCDFGHGYLETDLHDGELIQLDR